MIPHELALGPLLFSWDAETREIRVSRGGLLLATIEDIYLDTWAAFYGAARPYRGPG